MARQLGRWRVSDVAGIATSRISNGVPVRAPAPRRRKVPHIHIHLPPSPQSATRTHDAAPAAGGNRIRMNGRDQQGRNWNMLLVGPGADIEDIEGGQGLSQSSGVVSDTASSAGYGTVDQVRSNPGARLASYQRTLDDFYRVK
jgi:hypothetical protein